MVRPKSSSEKLMLFSFLPGQFHFSHILENPSLSERPDPPPEPPAEMPQDDELDSMAGTGHGLPSWTWGCHILVENMMKHWILGLSVLFGAKSLARESNG